MAERKQLSDFQRQVIILFKRDHATWGLSSCANVLPTFFEKITKHQFDNLVSLLKRDGSPLAGTRQKETGAHIRISTEKRQNVKDLAVSPVKIRGIEKKHMSQLQIVSEVDISKTSVHQILKDYKLKCYRKDKM